MAYIFILWSDGFDEEVASIFVAELRQVGLLVKVIGLSRQHASGAHGLILVPDFTLDQALPLATETACLIIPCQTLPSKHLNNDPRIRKFIEQINANQALFLVGHQDVISQIDLKQSAIAKDAMLIYPDIDQIIPFARDIAKALLERAANASAAKRSVKLSS